MVIFKVQCGEVVVDSFTTGQLLTEATALEAARKSRDQFNASEYGKINPARIVRGQRANKARQL